MKKLIALLFLVSLCLSFVACNSGEGKAIVGEWKSTVTGASITFQKDGTIDFYGDTETASWEYDKANACYIVTVKGLSPVNLKVETENGLRYIKIVERLYHIDDYEEAIAQQS